MTIIIIIIMIIIIIFIIINFTITFNSVQITLYFYKNKAKWRKEGFYLTTHSTHFIHGYMASDIW